MAKKTMRVILEVTVSDFTRLRRREMAKEDGCRVSELPRLEDTTPVELADLIRGTLSDTELQQEMFAGTDTWVRFTDCALISADWCEPTPKKRRPRRQAKSR